MKRLTFLQFVEANNLQLNEDNKECPLCKHRFQVPPWLKTKLFCPQCRTPIEKEPSNDLPTPLPYRGNSPRDFFGSLDK